MIGNARRIGQPTAEQSRDYAAQCGRSGSVPALFRPVGLVTNHWGWTPRGLWLWLRWGWAWPVAVWGIAQRRWWLGGPRYVLRQVKAGPVCFGWGYWVEPGTEPAGGES